MKIQLIKGSFPRQDAIELITKMLDVKIRFHESKIMKNQHEEDVKMREKRIKELQHDLDKIKALNNDNALNWDLESEISIDIR